MTNDANPATGFDRLLGFTLPGRNARGRAVRLGPTLDRVLAAHDYPPAIKQLLAEALVLTALMGGLLKDPGSQLTLQAQSSEGIVELLVCDYLGGAVRGYIKHDAGRIDELGVNPALPALFGDGSLAITFDLTGTRERYQGVVPLEGASLTASVESYFALSEQVPTLIRTAVSATGQRCIAGGLLLQHLAEGEEGGERLLVRETSRDWEHVEILGATISAEELVDPALSLEAIVWRLFHEEREVRAQPGALLSRGCRCTIEHFEEVLSRFSKEDRREMRDETGVILVDCAFCSREFPIQD
ncbi:MAG: Hsp33 family molecular chaperone HslO [Croceibacterium sp.]